jgi:hypothetical protein
MRKHTKTILLVIAALVILAAVFVAYDRTRPGIDGENRKMPAAGLIA